MSQSDNRVRSSGNCSRRIRRLILAVVLVLVVGGVCFLPSQMTNKLTIVNNSSEPRTVWHVTPGTFIELTDRSVREWRPSPPLIKDQVMPPQTRLTLTFSGRRHGSVIVAKEGDLNEDPNRLSTFSAAWGSRWTFGWDAENKEIRQPLENNLPRIEAIRV